MKPVRSADLSGVPVDVRSHGRTPAVQLLIDERNALIRTAVRFYPGASDREVARRLRSALSIYHGGRWRRTDRTEPRCPPQYAGRLDVVLWAVLKLHDHVSSEVTLRRALGVVVIHESDPLARSTSKAEATMTTAGFERGPANQEPFSIGIYTQPSYDVIEDVPEGRCQDRLKNCASIFTTSTL